MKIQLHSYLILLLGVLLVVPAAAQKKDKKEQGKGRPAWLNQRLKDANYYTGIGAASISKNASNYQEAARAFALQDLSGEIVVAISGETDFTQIENNDEVKELFQSSVKSLTENNLEGFELMGTYTEGDLFWSYYRLSKATYIANKRKRFTEAMANSESLLNRAKAEEQAGRIYQAFLMYTQAIEPLLPYLIAALEPEFKGKASEQNSLVSGALISLMSGIQIVPVSAEVSYKFGSKKDLPLPVRVTYKGGGKEIAVDKFPVKYAFAGEGNKGTFQSEFVNSDAQGIVNGVAAKLEPTKRGIVVNIAMNTDDFKVLFDKRVSLFTLGNVAIPSARIRVKTQGPSVQVTGSELSLGKALTLKILEPVIKDYLIEKGCVVNDPSGAYDFIIEIKSETRQGTTSGNAYQSLLNATITAIDANTEDEVVSLLIQDLKGVKFDFENASNDAYAKARKRLETEFLPTFINKLYN